MRIPIPMHPRHRNAWRVLLSYYMTNGLSAALGLLLISGGIHLWLGETAAAAASVGVVVCIPPDQAAPMRRKIWQLLPSALLGLPLFSAVLALHEFPLYLGMLLVPATFLAFLGGAWGKRGLPIVISSMFAMIFSMAMPIHSSQDTLLASSLHFSLGAILYLFWATIANSMLNLRYRTQMLAETLLSLAALVRTQSQLFSPTPVSADSEQRPITGQLLIQQAQLADQLQAARDILLESPRTRRRQQLAGLLIQVLELRDHLLATELDLDTLKAHPSHLPVLRVLQTTLERLSTQIEHLADALLTQTPPPPSANLRDELTALEQLVAQASPDPNAPLLSPTRLAQSLTHRVSHVNNEVDRMTALARGELQPDLSTVRTAWQMFVSPTLWSWKPLAAMWRWQAPPLRHAIRATLAIGSAYATSLALPWGTHDYWILLTIVVVLRGSLAQTLERRNHRVIGTLIGCLLSAALLAAHMPLWLMMLSLTLAQAVAHAFAIKRYLITAVAATVLGLLQSHLLNAGPSPVFDVIERVADTLIGAGFAWAFSYLLPSWERQLIPALVKRTLQAQARHARAALGLGQLHAIDTEPEIEWRLARREAYDSLSALVQAVQRTLSEPRAVRPPLEPLDRLLTHSYQMLAQLTAVKTMLRMQRDRLDLATIQPSLTQAIQSIESTLQADGHTAVWVAPDDPSAYDEAPPASNAQLTPWALRRIDLAVKMAFQMRSDIPTLLQSNAPSRL